MRVKRRWIILMAAMSLIAVAGLVVGENMVQAVEALDAYYGTELVNILTCKAITDGAFEFETVQEDGFDYKVVYAPKNE